MFPMFHILQLIVINYHPSRGQSNNLRFFNSNQHRAIKAFCSIGNPFIPKLGYISTRSPSWMQGTFIIL